MIFVDITATKLGRVETAFISKFWNVHYGRTVRALGKDMTIIRRNLHDAWLSITNARSSAQFSQIFTRKSLRLVTHADCAQATRLTCS